MPPQTKHAATTSPSPGDRTSIAWIVCLGALLAGSGNANAMDVSGQQSGVWRQADSPIRVIGTVEVAAGAVLTIEPGTVILVNGYYSSINVRGTLNASGTAPEATGRPSRALAGASRGGQGSGAAQRCHSRVICCHVPGGAPAGGVL